jgi:hypothetical protein
MAAARNLARQLAAIRQRYVSLEEMAEALRRHPGFEDLNRATISRWLERPTRRTALAIEILNSRRVSARLRIAQPNSLSVLPSTMLTWRADQGRSYGLLAARYGVEAHLTQTATGGEAFDLLERGQAEIALGSRDLLPQLGKDCRRLCTLSKTYIVGMTTQPVEAITDLRGMRFGFLTGSPFGGRMEALARSWGIVLPPPVGLATAKDCAEGLRSGRVHGIVGAATAVGQVRRSVERAMRMFAVPQGMLGSYEMEVAVNQRMVQPATVRAYLHGLRETAEYVNYRKTVEAFQAEIAERTQLERHDVRSILANSVFSVNNLEASTLLALWEQEVVRR